MFVSVWVSDVPTIVPSGADCPSSKSAFRFETLVVDATVNGAVPVVASDSKVFARTS